MPSPELALRTDGKVVEKTLRILHVNDLVEGGAGAESHLLALAARQAQAGHVVEIFAARLPLRSSRALATWWSFADASRMLAAIDAFEPDVVHAHNIARLSPSVLRAARKRRVPVVATLHDYRHETAQTLAGQEQGTSLLRKLVNQRKIRFVRKQIDRYCSLLLAPSASLLAHSKSWVRRAELRQIPYPIELPATVQPLREEARFLFLGRLVKEKGIATLCRAMELASAKVRLRVCGDGPLASLPAIAPRTEYVGPLDRRMVPELFSDTLALVMPSEWLENYPLSVLEAQAHGRAVIATRVGGLPEMLAGEQAGLLVDPFDAQALARCMERLAGDRALAARMGLAGRARVERENAVDVVDAKIYACYVDA